MAEDRNVELVKLTPDLSAMITTRIIEAERERKDCSVRLKLLTQEIRALKILEQRHGVMSKHLPKDSLTRGENEAQKKKGNGGSAKPAETISI